MEFFQVKSQTIDNLDEYRRNFCAVIVEKAKIFETPTQAEILAVSSVMPHVAEVAKNLTQWVSDEDAIWTFVGLNRFYTSQSAYAEAESWLKLGLKTMRTRFGEEHPDVATSLNNLAGLYESMGRYEQAEKLFEESLVLRLHILGENHPDTMSSIWWMATINQRKGNYEEAITYYLQALDIAQRVLGEAHPKTQAIQNNYLECLNYLADFNQSIGNYEESNRYRQQSIEILQKTLLPKNIGD